MWFLTLSLRSIINCLSWPIICSSWPITCSLVTLFLGWLWNILNNILLYSFLSKAVFSVNWDPWTKVSHTSKGKDERRRYKGGSNIELEPSLVLGRFCWSGFFSICFHSSSPSYFQPRILQLNNFPGHSVGVHLLMKILLDGVTSCQSWEKNIFGCGPNKSTP